MGEKPRHSRTWHAARSLIALMTVFALMVAPLVVILTHGPAAQAAAAASMTAEIAAHGHDHSHGHTYDDAGRDGHGDPLGGHNPADHDHQLQALICPPVNTFAPLPDKSKCVLSDVLRNIKPEGPLRPPRFV